MSESVRRVLRTLSQAGTAGVIVALVLAFVHLTPGQATAMEAMLTLLLAALHNGLEDAGVTVPLARGK